MSGRSDCMASPSPTNRQWLPLGITGRTLYADDRALMELGDVARAGIGARAAHTRDDLVEHVLDAGAFRVEIHARGGDALLEQRLARPFERGVAFGAAAHCS